MNQSPDGSGPAASPAKFQHYRQQSSVVFQGMRLAIAGVIVGLAAAFGLAKVIATFLFGVTARDPLVFTAVPLLLTVVAWLAVWLPAVRGSRIDPIIALRTE